MAKTITHKVRNPIYDKDHYPSLEKERWLNIWSANISSTGTYTITPSDNWVISGDKISLTSASNVLVQTDSNGKLKNGPQINSSGSLTKLLNEKGEWVEIEINGPITLDTSTSKIIIGHDKKNWPNDTNLFYLKLNGDNYWPGWPESTSSSARSSLIVNKYGHVEWANDIYIPLASSNYAGLVPKFTNSATDENKILKIVRNNNSNSIEWVNSTDLPVVDASTNGLTPSYGSNANGKILSIDDNIPTWIEPTDSINGGIPTATSTSNGLMPKSGGGARRVLYTNDFGSPVWTRSGGPGEILKVSDDGDFSWVTPRIDKTELGIGVSAAAEEGTITFGMPSNSNDNNTLSSFIKYMTNATLEYL